MEKILHQLMGSLSHYLQGLFTSSVVQDFLQQQYVDFQYCKFRNCYMQLSDAILHQLLFSLFFSRNHI